MTTNGEGKQAFTLWCRDELFTPELVQAASMLQKALDTHLLHLYAELGLPEQLGESLTPAALSTRLGFCDTAHLTLEAMLDRLASRFEFLSRVDGGEAQPSYIQVGEIPDPPMALEEIEARMLELGDDFSAPLEFLQFGADVFEQALGEDPDLLDRILSGRDSTHEELWFRATNVDPLQNVHGIMGARAIDLLFERGRILEIGGGTGNGVRNLLQHLDGKDELDRVEHYHFTDISQRFILATRHEIRRAYPDVSTDWRFADLNRPLREQNIEPRSFDLIYAVNAAHVAKDLVAFLESCKETLVPGGRVVFAERVRLTPRDMAPRELTLNLSIYHRTAAIRNEDYRPVHCYLTPEGWLRAFELSGFTHGEVWPDLDALAGSFPDQYAAVVTAVA